MMFISAWSPDDVSITHLLFLWYLAQEKKIHIGTGALTHTLKEIVEQFGLYK